MKVMLTKSYVNYWVLVIVWLSPDKKVYLFLYYFSNLCSLLSAVQDAHLSLLPSSV